MPGKVPPLDLGNVQIPPHFRCPISLELMRDPVTVCTGQTYDRSSIESWVATGNTTCPVSRHPLPSPLALIPNHTLRRLIQQWCSAHPGIVERLPTPKQPPDPSLLRSLLALSSSPSAPLPRRLTAIRRLRSLSLDNRARILLSDHRSALLLLAFSTDSPPELSLDSLSLLSGLQIPESDCRSIAAAPDRLRLLSRLLRSPDPESRAAAAGMVEAVTRSGDIRAVVGCFEGVMEGLVAMVREGEAPAVRALYALCLERANRERAARAGALRALVESMDGMGRGDLERAAALVEMLLRVEEGGEVEGIVGAMVGVMEKGATDRAAEHAAGALVVACERAGEAARREAVGSGAVALILVMVQGGCTERGRRKAQRLLKMLLEEGSSSDEFLLLFPLRKKQQQHLLSAVVHY